MSEDEFVLDLLDEKSPERSSLYNSLKNSSTDSESVENSSPSRYTQSNIFHKYLVDGYLDSPANGIINHINKSNHQDKVEIWPFYDFWTDKNVYWALCDIMEYNCCTITTTNDNILKRKNNFIDYSNKIQLEIKEISIQSILNSEKLKNKKNNYRSTLYKRSISKDINIKSSILPGNRIKKIKLTPINSVHKNTSTKKIENHHILSEINTLENDLDILLNKNLNNNLLEETNLVDNKVIFCESIEKNQTSRTNSKINKDKLNKTSDSFENINSNISKPKIKEKELYCHSYELESDLSIPEIDIFNEESSTSELTINSKDKIYSARYSYQDLRLNDPDTKRNSHLGYLFGWLYKAQKIKPTIQTVINSEREKSKAIRGDVWMLHLLVELKLVYILKRSVFTLIYGILFITLSFGYGLSEQRLTLSRVVPILADHSAKVIPKEEVGDFFLSVFKQTKEIVKSKSSSCGVILMENLSGKVFIEEIKKSQDNTNRFSSKTYRKIITKTKRFSWIRVKPERVLDVNYLSKLFYEDYSGHVSKINLSMKYLSQIECNNEQETPKEKKFSNNKYINNIKSDSNTEISNIEILAEMAAQLPSKAASGIYSTILVSLMRNEIGYYDVSIFSTSIAKISQIKYISAIGFLIALLSSISLITHCSLKNAKPFFKSDSLLGDNISLFLKEYWQEALEKSYYDALQLVSTVLFTRQKFAKLRFQSDDGNLHSYKLEESDSFENISDTESNSDFKPANTVKKTKGFQDIEFKSSRVLIFFLLTDILNMVYFGLVFSTQLGVDYAIDRGIAPGNTIDSIIVYTHASTVASGIALIARIGSIMLAFPRHSAIENTIRSLAPFFTGFLLLFLILFSTFTLLGRVIIGPELSMYRSWFSACFRNLFLLIGDWPFQELASLQRPALNGLFLGAYELIMFIALVNVFLAVITDTYTYKSERVPPVLCTLSSTSLIASLFKETFLYRVSQNTRSYLLLALLSTQLKKKMSAELETSGGNNVNKALYIWRIDSNDDFLVTAQELYASAIELGFSEDCIYSLYGFYFIRCSNSIQATLALGNDIAAKGIVNNYIRCGERAIVYEWIRHMKVEWLQLIEKFKEYLP